MRSLTAYLATVAVAALATTPARAATVEVSVTADATSLQTGDTTTVRVFAEVTGGLPGEDGLFSFDVDAPFSIPGVVGVIPGTIVHQDASDLGPPLSSPGLVQPDGLFASYDLYFDTNDGSIGIGTPQEIVRFDVQALAPGTVDVLAAPDDTDGNANSDGSFTGFLLLSGIDHTSDFAAAVTTLTVTAPPPPSVQVTLAADETDLAPGATTTVRVFAEVIDGVPGIDGLFSFDVHVPFSTTGIVQVVPGSIEHPDASNFSPPLSSLGVIQADGLYASYDVFFDQPGGDVAVGTPQEILRFDVEALAAGSVDVLAVPDDTDGNANTDGSFTGFLLLSGIDHTSDFVAATTTITVATPCTGDTNGDGEVDVNDLNNVILDWGTDGSGNGGDITGVTPGSPPDGIVNVNDLNAIFVGWGLCP